MLEGIGHIDAKTRLVRLLQSRGINAVMEKSNPLRIDRGNGTKVTIPYQYDVYFEINEKVGVAIEVDGRRGHSTTQAHYQDSLRDSAGMKIRPMGPFVLTIRLPTPWLVGPGALADNDILEEIVFHCNNNALEVPLLH